ncbi:MAG: HEAT repeat domain-containing protein [Pirellulales bacterium]
MRSCSRSKYALATGLTRAQRMWFVFAALGSVVCCDRTSIAVTPESPEVRKLIDEGLKLLGSGDGPPVDNNARKLGGKCLVALAFIKAGKPDHPRVREALEAVKTFMAPEQKVDVYSNGIAIVFLCELSAERHRREITFYLDMLEKRQKEAGGWGYDGNSMEGFVMETGDTSQTQYASLGYWTAYQHGFALKPESLERLTQWLLRTQDPSGVWGYQGEVAPASKRVKQSMTGCSMLAAGLGSTLICADLLDAIPQTTKQKSSWEQEELLIDDLPPALRVARLAGQKDRPPPVQLKDNQLDRAQIPEAIELARNWMSSNYSIDIGKYQYYYLYATERYQSFYELWSGTLDGEPQWYQEGYEYLKKNQLPDGGWEQGCGVQVDTAFAVLFLLRSTQKSIQASLGEGTLVGGRGLPANVAKAKLRGNQIIVDQLQTKVDQMLSMVDDEDQSKLDDLARDPTSLVVGKVDAAGARRLQQLVRGGEPPVRRLAVRALGRTGNLDYVPTLIYALTDPDRDVVLEARDALQFVSRRFDGFGPPDEYTDQQRYDAAERWKDWYRSLRPGAEVEE